MSVFWQIIKANWTLEERDLLRRFVETWMAANHSTAK